MVKLKDAINSDSSRKKILIVDDDDNILELIKSVLEQEGYDVIKAHNGEECLELLKTIKPDLILLDMMMPGMDGKEVCKRIRNDPKTGFLKVAFVSVMKKENIGEKFIDAMNISDCIAKPFTIEDLLRRVKRMIE